jgi:hypothetical protein
MSEVPLYAYQAIQPANKPVWLSAAQPKREFFNECLLTTYWSEST